MVSGPYSSSDVKQNIFAPKYTSCRKLPTPASYMKYIFDSSLMDVTSPTELSCNFQCGCPNDKGKPKLPLINVLSERIHNSTPKMKKSNAFRGFFSSSSRPLRISPALSISDDSDTSFFFREATHSQVRPLSVQLNPH